MQTEESSASAGKQTPPILADPETRKVLLAAISLGASFRQACDTIGIDTKTLWNSRERDPDLDGAIRKATAQGVVFHLRKIHEAANAGDWRASAFFLERKCPDEWARRDKVQVTGRDEGPVQVEGTIAFDHRKFVEEFERLAGQLGGADAEADDHGQPLRPDHPDRAAGPLPDLPGP